MTQQQHRSPLPRVRHPQPPPSEPPPSPTVSDGDPPQSAPPPSHHSSTQNSKFKIPKRLPYWLAGLGVVTLIALAFRPSPIPVDLGEVKRGPLQVTVDAEGKTRVRDRFTVAASVSGRLARIDLDPGDPIKGGTVIARIDPLPLNIKVRESQARLRELRAQLAGVETQRPKSAALAQAQAQIQGAIATQQQAEAKYQEAQADLAQTSRDRKRAQDLEKSGAQSRKVREDAELAETQRQQEVKAARNQVEVAAANVAAARKALSVLQAEQKDPDYLQDVYRAQIASTESTLTNLADEARRTAVRAPVGGNVLRVMEESARFVQAGDPLLELGNATQLELAIDVLSTDAVKVKPGASINIEHWGGEQPLQAQVRYLEPSAFTEVSALGVDEQRVNVIANFANPPRSLGDGYRVEAQIVVWEDEDALKVPLSALFRCGDQDWCTFVAEQGKAQRRQVVIGQRSSLEAAVDEGLKAGDQVILHPSEQIKAGQWISNRS
ncbi:Macrolide export protein MacA [Acaryochloris thomasi RCC1774]|uniref:Macrolide export protein MacA n=1 Tax=Acaryochloris thomasi RCC1774 TaxID=1764569 RepID=A0A2W1JPT8_9CYAN|nr:efflux RND transporter periplasmic adaptor subunit [Acaryochloris thomasi]PZD70907.1 Macrolide export protein MacA [Acaryochloris thomasi RCC1774]